MMGTGHTATGLAGAAVTLPIASAVGAHPAAWTAAWVAGAMLSDLDTSGSHGARVWGAPTRALGGLIGKVAGGHREDTHDIVWAPILTAVIGWVVLVAAWAAGGFSGVGTAVASAARVQAEGLLASPPRTAEGAVRAAADALVAVATQVPPLAILPVLVVALIIGIAIRMTLGQAGVTVKTSAGRISTSRVFRNPFVNFAISVTAATALLANPAALWWAPIVIAIGVVTHILGDSITTEGAPRPKLTPWQKHTPGKDGKKDSEWGLRLFNTGTWPDLIIRFGLTATAAYFFLANLAPGVIEQIQGVSGVLS